MPTAEASEHAGESVEIAVELTPAMLRRQGGPRARRLRLGLRAALGVGALLAVGAAVRGLPMALLAQLAALGFVWLLARAIRQGERHAAAAWGLPRTVRFRLGPAALHAELGAADVAVHWGEVEAVEDRGDVTLEAKRMLLFLPRETGLSTERLAPWLAREPALPFPPLPEGRFAGQHPPVNVDRRWMRHWERQPMEIEALAVTWLGLAIGTAISLAIPAVEGPVLAGACVLAYVGWRLRRATRPTPPGVRVAAQVVFTETAAIRRDRDQTVRVPWSEIARVEAYDDILVLRGPLPLAIPAETFGEDYGAAVDFATRRAGERPEPSRPRARPDADNPFAAPDDAHEPVPSVRWGSVLFWLALFAVLAFLAMSD